MDPLGRAREEASGVHGRALIERRRRELIAIFKLRQQRIARTRFAWAVRLVIATVGGAASGFLLAVHHGWLAPADRAGAVVPTMAALPARLPSDDLQARRQQSTAGQTVPTASLPTPSSAPQRALPAPGRNPSNAPTTTGPVMPTLPPGRPGAPVESGRRPDAGAQQDIRPNGGFYEAPQHKSEAPAIQAQFRIVGIPVDGVALVQQGSTIKPIRVGERLPNNALLKAAAAEAAFIESSAGRVLVDRRQGE